VELLEARTMLAVVALGSEFRVNEHTTSFQLAPRAAAAPDGSFVIVWSSTGQAGTAGVAGEDIYARRYTAAGTPTGSEFLVNTFTTNHQSLPSIAMDEAGNFVIVWHSRTQDGGDAGVYGQRFDASGAAQGGEFAVNQHTTSSQQYATVAMDADGDFVVAWESVVQDGSSYGVYARRYNSAGVAQGDEFLVPTTTAAVQAAATVAMDDAGNFVIAWGSSHGGSYDIYARRFSAAGAPAGDEFLVNTSLSNTQYFPWAAMDADGDFVVVWQSSGQDTSGYGIYGQRFNSAGAPVGAEIAVNTFVPFDQDFPYVSMNDSGKFIVVWDSNNQDGDLFGSYAQVFDSNGARIGAELRTNTFTTEDQSFPAAALADNGLFVVAWQSRLQDGSQHGIYAQRYDLDLVAPAVNGNEFQFLTSPHTISFTFSEDVSASISTADVTVTPLPSGAALPLALVGYDTNTNTATFSFPGAVNGILSDGRYRATVFAAGVTDAAGNVLAANSSFDFFFMNGDANRDERVDSDDFNILATNFGLGGRNFGHGDFTYNGFVDSDDFNLLAGKFGTTLPAATFSVARIGGPGKQRVIDSLRTDVLG
jgi:hypothetical protein